jgi:hypothetical protein
VGLLEFPDFPSFFRLRHVRLLIIIPSSLGSGSRLSVRSTFIRRPACVLEERLTNLVAKREFTARDDQPCARVLEMSLRSSNILALEVRTTRRQEDDFANWASNAAYCFSVA